MNLSESISRVLGCVGDRLRSFDHAESGSELTLSNFGNGINKRVSAVWRFHADCVVVDLLIENYKVYESGAVTVDDDFPVADSKQVQFPEVQAAGSIYHWVEETVAWMIDRLWVLDERATQSTFPEEHLRAVELACKGAVSVCWDGCHKIYINCDRITHESVLEMGYDCIEFDHPDKAVAMLSEMYQASCQLRFIHAVSNVDDFTNVIGQFDEI